MSLFHQQAPSCFRGNLQNLKQEPLQINIHVFFRRNSPRGQFPVWKLQKREKQIPVLQVQVHKHQRLIRIHADPVRLMFKELLAPSLAQLRQQALRNLKNWSERSSLTPFFSFGEHCKNEKRNNDQHRSIHSIHNNCFGHLGMLWVALSRSFQTWQL